MCVIMFVIDMSACICVFVRVCLRAQEGESFLDIGCGWGTLVRHAAKHYGAKATVQYYNVHLHAHSNAHTHTHIHTRTQSHIHTALPIP